MEGRRHVPTTTAGPWHVVVLQAGAGGATGEHAATEVVVLVRGDSARSLGATLVVDTTLAGGGSTLGGLLLATTLAGTLAVLLSLSTLLGGLIGTLTALVLRLLGAELTSPGLLGLLGFASLGGLLLTGTLTLDVLRTLLAACNLLLLLGRLALPLSSNLSLDGPLLLLLLLSLLLALDGTGLSLGSRLTALLAGALSGLLLVGLLSVLLLLDPVLSSAGLLLSLVAALAPATLLGSSSLLLEASSTSLTTTLIGDLHTTRDGGTLFAAGSGAALGCETLHDEALDGRRLAAVLAARGEELGGTLLGEDDGGAAPALHECSDASTTVALLGHADATTLLGELPFAELGLLLGALLLEAWETFAQLGLHAVIQDTVLPAAGDTRARSREGTTTTTETSANTTTGGSEEVLLASTVGILPRVAALPWLGVRTEFLELKLLGLGERDLSQATTTRLTTLLILDGLLGVSLHLWEAAVSAVMGCDCHGGLLHELLLLDRRESLIGLIVSEILACGSCQDGTEDEASGDKCDAFHHLPRAEHCANWSPM